MMGLLKGQYGGVPQGPTPVGPTMTALPTAPLSKANPRKDNLKVKGPKAQTKGKKAGNLGKRIFVNFG